MTTQELATLKNDFSFNTGLKVTTELLYSDVVIIPELQSFNVLNLRAIESWITNTFTIEGKYSHKLPTLTMIPQGQTRYVMGVRLSQTQAVSQVINKKWERVGITN